VVSRYWEGIKDEVVVVLSEALSLNLLGGTEYDHENSQSEQTFFGTRSEHETSLYEP
jgi:hypothetical protein